MKQRGRYILFRKSDVHFYPITMALINFLFKKYKYSYYVGHRIHSKDSPMPNEVGGIVYVTDTKAKPIIKGQDDPYGAVMVYLQREYAKRVGLRG